MPRHPRIVVPGIPLHIVQRGHNRAPTFHLPDEFARYRDLLGEAATRYRCAVHAYVLMTNHVHLLVTPDDADGPARTMQLLGRRYVRWSNARHRRTGTLWDGRYWSCPVDGGRYLFACSRYIERNPVRAGMVDHPAAYRWSSHRRNAFGEPDDLVAPHPVYAALGPTPDTRATAYRALFGADEESDQLAVLRRAVRRGLVVGDEAFREGIETVVGHPTTRLAHGGARRSGSRGQSR